MTTILLFTTMCVPFLMYLYCLPCKSYQYSTDFDWNHKINMLVRDLIQYKHELVYPSLFKYNHQLSTFDKINVGKILNQVRIIQISLDLH